MLELADFVRDEDIPYRETDRDWSWLEGADLRDDLIFKAALDDAEDVTALLLTACGLEYGKIISVKAAEPFPSLYKTIIPDVTVRTDDGSIISIDMQTSRNADIIERMAYYGSALYSSLLEEGYPYKNLQGKRATVIFFYVKDVFKKKKPIYTFTWKDKNTPFITIEYVLVKMASQRKDFLGSVVHDICTSKPEEIHNRILRERLRLIKESEGGKLMMNPLLRKERMEGRKEGRALGREEGREIGKEEGIILGKNSGKKEVAENLLKTTSLSLETIANVTNLPIEEITTLKANI